MSAAMKMTGLSAVVAAGLLLCLSLFSCAGKKESSKTTIRIKAAVIETNKGRIVLQLFEKDAPETVANFEKLASSGFYNGLTFHRYVPNFVIQGGDPKGDGTGNPGYRIKFERSPRKHLRGAVAMALSPGDPDSGGSQFYITLVPTPHLNGDYCVFGQVVKGMGVVGQLRQDDVMKSVTITEMDI
jgi:peptidyl-prolyl cis-trans isomerase B (cyclophilin B)